MGLGTISEMMQAGSFAVGESEVVNVALAMHPG